MNYEIGSGVYSVTLHDSVIILDSNNNRYLALDELGTEVWNTLKGSNPDYLEPTSKDIAAQLDFLVNEKLVTTRGNSIVSEIKNYLDSSTTPESDYISNNIAVSFKSYFLLLKAAIIYKAYLCNQPVNEAIRYLQSIRLQREKNSIRGIDPTIRLYKTFRSIYRFGTRDCFQRSYILSLALAYQGIDSRLFIGVDNFPFKAHAWVQIDSQVINDKVSNLRDFTPIAVF